MWLIWRRMGTAGDSRRLAVVKVERAWDPPGLALQHALRANPLINSFREEGLLWDSVRSCAAGEAEAEPTSPPAANRWLGSGNFRCLFRLKPATSHPTEIGVNSTRSRLLQPPQHATQSPCRPCIHLDNVVAHVTREAGEGAARPRRLGSPLDGAWYTTLRARAAEKPSAPLVICAHPPTLKGEAQSLQAGLGV